MQATYSQVNRLRRGVALMEICAMIICRRAETLRSYWRDVRPQDWLCPGNHRMPITASGDTSYLIGQTRLDDRQHRRILLDQDTIKVHLLRAATPVLPVPANGSRMRPPPGQISVQMSSISGTGLTLGWSD